jgi:hypothetical protein
LRIFIPPYHNTIRKLIQEDDTQERSFEVWRKYVVKLAQRNNIEVWDFSGATIYTSEVIPNKSDRATIMNWYWDPGHFRSSLGDLILERILQSKSSADEFGQRLASVRIEQQSFSKSCHSVSV